MKNRLLAVLIVISLGVNIGFLLHWLRPRLFPARAAAISSGWHSGPMKRHLNLDAGQSRRMERERRQVLAQARPLQEELRQKRRELFVLLKGKDVGAADLDPILNEISRLQAAMEKLFILHSLKVRSLFSPAQRLKYEGFLEQGLCPGMMSGEACAPAKAGQGMKRAGCREAGAAKMQFK
jgi:hypothetical protein